MVVRHALESNRVRVAMPCTLTHRHPPVFPVVSCFVVRILLLFIHAMTEDSVSMLSVSGGLRSDVEPIHKCILSCLSSCRKWHGRLHILQI